MKNLEDLFGAKPEVVRKPKNVKITKVQMLEHKAKRGVSPEVKASIIEAKEIRKYGKEARAKLARKEDTRGILIEKGTRPKGKFYDLTPYASPLQEVFKIDGGTPEGQAEVRIHHFGGSLN